LEEEDPLSVLPMALSAINEICPYRSAYGHDIGRDIGHDMSCPYVTYVIRRSEHLKELAALFLRKRLWQRKAKSASVDAIK
jgi:hypothetical protein